MTGVRPILIFLTFVAGGCAHAPIGAGAHRAAIAAAANSAAAQVQRCYRAPRIPSSGKQIVTRLQVRFTPDGSLAGMPVLLSQSNVTPDNGFYAGKMAEAAGLAVIKCAPVRLPLESYDNGWNVLELTFSPRARA